VPPARFIALLTYTAEVVGIQVQITEESSTSQASFLSGQLPRRGSTPGLRSCPSDTRLEWAAGQARALSRGGWAVAQRGCEWRVHHPAQRSPKRLGQWDRGCGRSPGQDDPGEWAAWQHCPCCLELSGYQNLASLLCGSIESAKTANV